MCTIFHFTSISSEHYKKYFYKCNNVVACFIDNILMRRLSGVDRGHTMHGICVYDIKVLKILYNFYSFFKNINNIQFVYIYMKDRK